MALKNGGLAGQTQIIAQKLVAMAKQEPRHVSWPASKFFWSSTVKNTALAANALFTNDKTDPNVPRALAFLLNRKKVSPCNCTQDNLYLSLLITGYAKGMKEDETDFNAIVGVDKKVMLEKAFDKKNLLSVEKTQVPMKELSSLKMPADINIKKNGAGTLYYDLLLKYYLPPSETPTREEGLIISREYYSLDDAKEQNPLTEFRAGENYKGNITIIAPQDLNYVIVQDLLPSGFEPIDMTLATSSRAAMRQARGEETSPDDFRGERFMGYDDVITQPDYGMSWGFNHQEVRDDAIVWSDEIVPAGVYHIRYPVRATTAGQFLMPGAVAFEFYEPEIFGRSKARMITINAAE